jgi:cysteine synthase A
VIAVCDSDCILMAQKLAAELGIAVSIGSGANFLADVQAQDELGDDAVVAAVFADDDKKYLSTNLLRCEPIKSHCRDPEVILTGFRAVRRVCNVCGDAEDCGQRVTIV